MSVRRELLERELKKLGFRKAGAQGTGAREPGVAQQQQQPQGNTHPKADGEDAGRHAD
jgi:hypothetical protein